MSTSFNKTQRDIKAQLSPRETFRKQRANFRDAQQLASSRARKMSFIVGWSYLTFGYVLLQRVSLHVDGDVNTMRVCVCLIYTCEAVSVVCSLRIHRTKTGWRPYSRYY